MTQEPKIKHLLREVERKLKAVFHDKLDRIILYGSYARGDYGKESDIDIMVLIHDGDLKKYDHQILRINVDFSIRYDVNLSVIIEDKTDFDLNADVIPLFRNIHREGVYLYAA
jgi:predicted nucleotidyltransferase